MQKSILAACIAGLLAACGGDDSENDPRLLVRVIEVPAGPSCADGGQRILTGPDLNNNGVLDDQEAQASEDFCHQGPVRALLKFKPEPAGSECSFGGVAIQAGADTNRDGELNASEVTSMRYICHPPPDLSHGVEPDRQGPTITTTAPTVASSWATSFRTVIRSNVGLAYAVFVDGTRWFPVRTLIWEQDDTVNIALGQTYRATLLAFDTFNYVSSKAITITTPETGIKLGSYAVDPSRRELPEGFNCGGPSLESRYGKLDGVSFDTVELGSERINGLGVDWSQDGGYSLSLKLAGLRLGQVEAIPLEARSALWESPLGTYTVDYFPVDVSMSIDVDEAPGNPDSVFISLEMLCYDKYPRWLPTRGTRHTFLATFKG